MEFYFQALRKTMKRKTKKDVGVTILNNRIYSGQELRCYRWSSSEVTPNYASC